MVDWAPKINYLFIKDHGTEAQKFEKDTVELHSHHLVLFFVEITKTHQILKKGMI